MIDIDNLTEAELIELNNRIVERLRYLEQLETHATMLKFRVGDRVSFRGRDGREITGVLKKYNKKTVTVVSDTGQRWNVSPGFLRQEAMDTSFTQSPTVVLIKRD